MLISEAERREKITRFSYDKADLSRILIRMSSKLDNLLFSFQISIEAKIILHV